MKQRDINLGLALVVRSVISVGTQAVENFRGSIKKEARLYRIIAALWLGLMIPLSCIAEQSIVGTYKVVSYVIDIDGVPKEIFGKAPRGYLVVTPTHWLVVITAETRKFGPSVEEKAALWDSMNAHAGTYRLEGKMIVVSVDTSYNEFWNGSEQRRMWDLQGKRLMLTTLPAPYSKDPSKTVVARVVYERIE